MATAATMLWLATNRSQWKGCSRGPPKGRTPRPTWHDPYQVRTRLDQSPVGTLPLAHPLGAATSSAAAVASNALTVPIQMSASVIVNPMARSIPWSTRRARRWWTRPGRTPYSNPLSWASLSKAASQRKRLYPALPPAVERFVDAVRAHLTDADRVVQKGAIINLIMTPSRSTMARPSPCWTSMPYARGHVLPQQQAPPRSPHVPIRASG